MAITITQINLYPVKSLRGIAVDASSVTTRGLGFDRRFMLVDRDDQFLTQRALPQMATIATEIVGEALHFVSAFGDRISVPLQPRPQPTRTVTVWSSRVEAHAVSTGADAFFAEQLGGDVRLVYMPDSAQRRCSPEYAKNDEIVSFADGYPVLIASEESLAELNARIVASGGGAVPMNRFRPNIVVSGGNAFDEDHWDVLMVGNGHVSFRNAKPSARCQITTTDQATGEVRGPEPLQSLARFRDSPSGVLFGANLLPITLGDVCVGDEVILKQ